jgi:AhpD family alkylhydroperoxidase
VSGNIIRVGLRKGSYAQVRHVAPVRFGAADDVVADVYRAMEHDFGVLAPPVILHGSSPQITAASWMMLREALLVPGLAGRRAKEAVAASVSVANTCPFCVHMHSSTLHSLIRGGAAAAIAEDRIEAVADERLRALALWAVGDPTPGAATTGQVPFPAEQAAELVAVTVLFHYLNRMVNVFLGEAPLPPGVPGKALRPVTRVLTHLIRGASGKVGAPGESLGLLAPAPLPRDMSWAAGNEPVAQAFARAAAAIESAGARSVPARVRELVAREVAAAGGLPKPMNKAWVQDAVEVLPESERAAGRLALLTALASFQVGDVEIAAFRERRPDDADLIGLTAWASLTAARESVVRLRMPTVGVGARRYGAE